MPTGERSTMWRQFAACILSSIILSIFKKIFSWTCSVVTLLVEGIALFFSWSIIFTYFFTNHKHNYKIRNFLKFHFLERRIINLLILLGFIFSLVVTWQLLNAQLWYYYVIGQHSTMNVNAYFLCPRICPHYICLQAVFLCKWYFNGYKNKGSCSELTTFERGSVTFNRPQSVFALKNCWIV